MKFDPNDPKLTAYALGELEGADRAEVETLLKENEEARRTVDEIRQLSGLLGRELGAEPCPELLPDQRNKIVSESESSERKILSFPTQWFTTRPFVLTLVAASLMIGLGIHFTQTHPTDFGSTPSPSKDSKQVPAAKTAEKKSAQAFGLISAKDQGVSTSAPQSASVDVSKEKQMEMQPLSESSVLKDEMAETEPSAPAVGGQASRAVATREIDRSPAQARSYAGMARKKPVEAPAFSPAPTGYLQSNELSLKKAEADSGTEVEKNLPAEAEGRSGAADEFGSNDRDRLDRKKRSPDSIIEIHPPRRPSSVDFETESYDHVEDNPFLSVRQNPLSTFSIDVDTASYSNVRRFLDENRLPPPGAVRIEEMINYFPYAYPEPKGDNPFSVQVDMATCPWKNDHQLVRIGLKGKDINWDERKPSNLVFLIDVSGSMEDSNKLPLLKKSLKLLIDRLREEDRVAIVVYAGNSGMTLPSTSGENKHRILKALDHLEAGGSTNGGSGIELAYKVARKNFIRKGNNRIILCTDGDFNVGVTNQSELVRLIEREAKEGTFLTVLGFGMGNFKDSTLEKLADRGNGNYAYINDLHEARKVLVEQMSGTLETIAKDVKIQVEFNPNQVKAFRLIGYENRLLRKEDFNDDTKDAGELGAGTTVTALYEVVPPDADIELPEVDELKYQDLKDRKDREWKKEILTVKLRYKEPTADRSRLMEYPFEKQKEDFPEASPDFRFAASVAAFGMILRDSPHCGNATLDQVRQWVKDSLDKDSGGYRNEFFDLVTRAADLKKNSRERPED